MQQTKKSGIGEFFITLFVIFIIIALCSVMRAFIESYAVFADILCLVLICIWGFLVLTHYSARFFYTCDDNVFRCSRMVGKRNKEIEFPISSIVSISSKKPQTKYIYSFTPSILPKKSTKYICFDHDRLIGAVVIEVDAEMSDYLKKFKKID